MRVPIIFLFFFTSITFLVTAFWDVVSAKVIPEITWGLYSKSFFENVLVEVHGAIFDLAAFGIILYWFEKRRDQRDQIEELEEELIDLRLYRAADAPYRSFAIIRKLLVLGKNKLQASELRLSELDIKNMKFEEFNLRATVFTDSRMKNVMFESCKCDAAIFSGVTMEHVTFVDSSLKRAKFQNATLNGIDLRTCQIQGADFTNASLRSANFSAMDCADVKFKNADLRSANFLGAQNLDLKAIATATYIRNLKTDDKHIAALVKSAIK